MSKINEFMKIYTEKIRDLTLNFSNFYFNSESQDKKALKSVISRTVEERCKMKYKCAYCNSDK